MNSTKATNIRWRVLFITLVIGYIAYVYRGNLSVIGKFLMDDTGISQTRIGLASLFIFMGLHTVSVPRRSALRENRA